MSLLVAPAQLRLLGCPLCAMAVTHYPAMLLTHRRDRPSRRALPCSQDDRALAGRDRIGKALCCAWTSTPGTALAQLVQNRTAKQLIHMRSSCGS
jgi:hypothetical protein